MSTFEKLENNQVKLTIEVSPEVFESGIVEVYNKQKGKFSIPGFRKGKAPRKVIEQQYGAGIFYEDAFNAVFPKCYEDAVAEHNVEPVDRPEIDILEVNPAEKIVFTATVTVKPEVKLGQYTGIEFAKVEYNVKDEDVDAEIAKAQDRVARLEDVTDRAVENGDNLTIDYSGSVDGVKFDGGTAENQPLIIGSGAFIPGFEEQLIGMNIGEERDITVTFPEQYHAPDLAGKEAVFHVKVNQIKAKIMPELNDEFAKDVSEFDTLQEYKDDIAKKLADAAAKRADTEMENALLEKIAENAEIDLPAVMVETEIDNMIRDMEMRMYYQGLRMEDYLKFTNTTMEQLREQNKDMATQRTRMRLVLEEIIKVEKVEADQEGIDKELEKMSQWSGKSLDEYKSTVTEQQMEYITQQVVFDNVLKFLKENNQFK